MLVFLILATAFAVAVLTRVVKRETKTTTRYTAAERAYYHGGDYTD